MMTNWLVNRLRPSHAKKARWVELAEALQTVWHELFDIPFNVLSNTRSIYTADEPSQLRKIEEYGWYYWQDMPTINRPIFFGMRKLDMHQKETALLVERAVQMATGSHIAVQSTVVPLYALDGEAYGTRFFTEKQLSNMGIYLHGRGAVTLDGSWHLGDGTRLLLQTDAYSYGVPYLTSRAVIQINLADLAAPVYAPKLLADVKKIKPLHIVIDGLLYLIEIQGHVSVSADHSLKMSKRIDIPYPGNLRIDGSWKIGTYVTLPPRKLDGTWAVGSSGSVVLGEFVGTGVSHERICERRIHSSTSIKITSDIPRSLSSHTFARLRKQALKLDRTWKVSADHKLDGSWKLDGLALSCPKLGVPVSYIDNEGWEGVFPTAGRLDGAWRIGQAVGGPIDVLIRKIST